jgi:hypothetical protein
MLKFPGGNWKRHRIQESELNRNIKFNNAQTFTSAKGSSVHLSANMGSTLKLEVMIILMRQQKHKRRECLEIPEDRDSPQKPQFSYLEIA